MAAPLPTVIILALGAAALGGPDALRILLEFTEQSPCLDIAICMLLMFTVTAYLLGAVLLVRFVRDARSGDAAGVGGRGAQGHGAAAAATDCLAQVSLLVSACVGFLVAAVLIALPSVPSGGFGALSFVTYFDGKNSVVVVAATVTVAIIAAAAASARASSERFSRTRQTVCFVLVALLLAAVSRAAPGGGLDAQRFFSGFPCRSPITDVPVGVGVAIATVAGTTLVACFSRRVRNATTGAAAPTPGTGTWRRCFGLAVVACLLAVLYADTQCGSESDGGEHANSA